MSDEVMTVKDAAQFLKIGLSKMYALVNLRGFPRVRIGRRVLIPKARLMEWLNSQSEV